MNPAEKFEEWLKAEPLVKSAVSYGSRQSDLDYMVFLEGDKTAINPALIWPGCVWNGGGFGCLAIVGESMFDLSITRLPLQDSRFVKLADMLRNSEPEPVWVKDELGLADRVKGHIATNHRKTMTEEEILKMVRGLYINCKFLVPKIWKGSLYGRYLVAHALESTILNLAREADLRRGGKGLWKGRDAEKTFGPAELEMLTVNYTLDQTQLAESLVMARIQVRYWLKTMSIAVPEYLCKPW